MIAFANQMRDVKKWAVRQGGMREDEQLKVKSVEATDLAIIRDEREGVNGDYFEFTAIANTASVDLDDEVVVPEGADPSYFFRFRTLYLNHDINLVVGRLRFADLIPGIGWKIGGILLGNTTVALDTRELMRHDLIRGVSIGFVGLEYGRPTKDEIKTYGDHTNIIRKWRWLETSVTPMPCNPDALIHARSKGMIREETALVLGLDDTRPKMPKTTIVMG